MRTFFIDLENVKNQGFVGVERLTADDRVFVFYSDNANSLSIPTIQAISRSQAQIEYVPLQRSGHNAMDFQIVGLLGFMIGSEKSGYYCIISQDQGYLAPVDFFMDHSAEVLDVHVQVAANINVALKKWDSLRSARQRVIAPPSAAAQEKNIFTVETAEEAAEDDAIAEESVDETVIEDVAQDAVVEAAAVETTAIEETAAPDPAEIVTIDPIPEKITIEVEEPAVSETAEISAEPAVSAEPANCEKAEETVTETVAAEANATVVSETAENNETVISEEKKTEAKEKTSRRSKNSRSSKSKTAAKADAKTESKSELKAEPKAETQKSESKKAEPKKNDPKKAENMKADADKVEDKAAPAEEIQPAEEKFVVNEEALTEKVHAIVSDLLTEEQLARESFIVQALINTNGKNDFYHFFRKKLGKEEGGNLYHAVRGEYEHMIAAMKESQ